MDQLYCPCRHIYKESDNCLTLFYTKTDILGHKVEDKRVKDDQLEIIFIFFLCLRSWILKHLWTFRALSRAEKTLWCSGATMQSKTLYHISLPGHLLSATFMKKSTKNFKNLKRWNCRRYWCSFTGCCKSHYRNNWEINIFNGGHIMLFCLFQPINDVTKLDCSFKWRQVWNNEVGVCSNKPCGLFLMALKAPLSSVF